MKNLCLFLFSMVLLCTACSKDDPTDFTGTYTGAATCSSQPDPEDTVITVVVNTDGTYTMTIDGEASFIGTAEDNILTFDRQTPIDAAFEPFLEGTLTENEDGTFLLVVTVDEDGDIYNCNVPLTKQ